MGNCVRESPTAARSAARRSVSARRAALLALVPLLVAVGGPGVARGSDGPGPDTFTPAALPAVALTRVDTHADDEDVVASTIVPADPRSVRVTEVRADVTVPGGVVSDLVEVTLCLFLVDDAGSDGCAPDGDPATLWSDPDPAPDPSTHLVMTWRPDRVDTDLDTDLDTAAGFAVVGSNLHLDADSTSDLATIEAGATVVALRFRFRTSVALLADPDGWAVRVVAVDINGNHSAVASDVADWQRDGLGVDEFRSAVSGREPLAFGMLLPGAERIVEGLSSGAFLANAPSALTVQGSDFAAVAGGTASVVTLRGDAGEPLSGELTLDCNSGSTFASDPIRLTAGSGTPAFLETDLYPRGTGETQDSGRTYSCRIAYGGGATGIGRQHAGTIAIAIAPAPAALPAPPGE